MNAPRLFPVDPDYEPPIAWPGGKTTYSKHIAPLIGFPEELVSPFLGGGSVELRMAARGSKIYAADLNQNLIQYWEQVLQDSKAVAAAARRIWPHHHSQVTREAYKHAVERYPETEGTERAAYYLYLSEFGYRRMPYEAGAWWAGKQTETWGNGVPEERKLLRLEAGYHLPNFKVRCQDWKETLAHTLRGQVAFFDPPYPGGNTPGGHSTRLYGAHEFPFVEFYKALRELDVPWLLTIQPNDTTLEYLGEFPRITFTRTSKIKQERKVTEAIITNRPTPIATCRKWNEWNK